MSADFWQVRDWDEEDWQVGAVTALPPGWRNVFEDDAGGLFATPCPALLLLEHRNTVHYCEYSDGEVSTSYAVNYEPPFETRVVYAHSDPGGDLVPAPDTDGYVGSIPPDANPEDL